MLFMFSEIVIAKQVLVLLLFEVLVMSRELAEIVGSPFFGSYNSNKINNK